MAVKLTRRQFNGLIIATTTIGGLGVYPSSVSAQTAKKGLVIVGVEHGDIVKNSHASTVYNIDATLASDDDPNTEYVGKIVTKDYAGMTEDYTNLPPSTTPASCFQAIVLRFLNLETGKITRRIVNQPVLSPGERLTGLTYLANGTLLVAITPDSAGANGSEPTRFLILNKSSQTISVSGLKVDQALDSLLLLKSGSLIGLVTKKDGTGPAEIVDVNPKTGKVSFTNRISLPADRRFSCLAEAPDGTLYTSVFRANATTELLKLNLAQKTVTVVAKLTVDGMPWYHGIQSLILTLLDQLVALANLEYRLPNSVYTIQLDTGVMTKVRDLKASRATLLTNISTKWGIS
jgi:hypothetical protein